MLFNSLEFILFFLPLSLIVYFLLNRLGAISASRAWLVACSFFFYGWWDYKYVPLLAASALFNYFCGAYMGKNDGPAARRALILAVTANLLLLGYFKYVDFFLENSAAAFGAEFSPAAIALPLAISFFTFTQIAYLVDAHNKTAREYSMSNYALFVTFFPHLMAGPIIHHGEMMPQFESPSNKRLDWNNLTAGAYLFGVGLFKKVAIADAAADWANAGFAAAGALSLVEAWVASLSYTVQIYFDFSGYTDMALGAALMFNIKLPENFASPYKAISVRDFWQRWHMTLSRFLRDYVYIPLGGNRSGSGRVLFNLMAVFLIGGLWHGAGWTFLAWGFLHGIAMSVERLWRGAGLQMPRPLAWFLTFNFINATWVFFRAESIADALGILRAMVDFGSITLPTQLIELMPALGSIATAAPLAAVADGTLMGLVETALFLAFSLFVALCFKNSNEMSTRRMRLVFILTVAFALQSVLFYQYPSEFLYFRF
jgi:D-alanyl-lipoteichoic acid acyltransferase DltB (MBOAT superfamily)